MDRRHFLRHAAAGLAAAPLAATHATLLAAPRAPARLLVVFLRGAYDAASLLVPVGSDFYYEARPQLAVPRPGSGPDAALPLAGGWGLHPALADSMAPLYARGELAFVPFAGTDDTSRSHFETQDRIELGQPLAGNRDYRSGFLNRLAAVLHPAPGPQARDAIAFTDQVPLVLRGGVEVPNLSLAALPGRPALDDRQSGLVSAMYAATPLAESVRDGFAVRADATRALQDEMQAASRDAIGAKGFEGEARRMARLMQDRYRLGFVDVGGWDTHVGQGQGGRGYLADRLGALGRGLAAYADGMGAAWRDTAVVVISEFGRTFRENGSRGTDHGHGSVYWVLGGAVRGGRIAGEQVAVVPQALFQNRDYPVLNDYRSVLGGLFARLYGLSPAQVQQVFPAAAPRDLGLA